MGHIWTTSAHIHFIIPSKVCLISRGNKNVKSSIKSSHKILNVNGLEMYPVAHGIFVPNYLGA